MEVRREGNTVQSFLFPVHLCISILLAAFKSAEGEMEVSREGNIAQPKLSFPGHLCMYVTSTCIEVCGCLSLSFVAFFSHHLIFIQSTGCFNTRQGEMEVGRELNTLLPEFSFLFIHVSRLSRES